MKFKQSCLRTFVRLINLALFLIFCAPCIFTASAAEYDQSLSEGDLITFGRYEQDNDQSNGMETITWRVLVVEDDRVLLISESNLDCKAFNPEEGSYTWETCELRNWLNGEFSNTAFTEKEREVIQTITVKNDDNSKYGTSGGKDTQDQIFLLSIAEAQDYFKDDNTRRAKNTAYAKAQGAYEEDGFGGWWLRSPGDRKSYAATVNGTGSVRRGGRSAHKADRAIRPALWVNIQQLMSIVNGQGIEQNALSTNGILAPSDAPKPSSDIIQKINDSELLWSNVNISAVRNGETACYVDFELEQDTVVTFIRTYHYFSGGAMPGQLMLYAETGMQWGPFQAVGADGQGNVKNAYWVANTGGIELPAGRYAVEDSNPETWSSNEVSGFEGFLEVFGYVQTADFQGNPFVTESMDSMATTTLLTENDSLVSETTVPAQQLAPGDLITFGHYEQDNDRTNGAEAIYWRVLDLDENKAFLISVYNLDCGKYHEQLEAITWENATLRRWLNNDFLNTAFTQQEQESIVTATVSNEDNFLFGTDGGSDTQDKVFLLSLAEVEDYFCDDDDRRALNTPFVQAQVQGTNDNNGYGTWWLRSPGIDSVSASYMSSLFSANSIGYYVDLTSTAIRPALYIKLGAGSPFGSPENSPMMDIETSTLEETPVSVEFNPGGEETAGISAPEALSGLWMVTTTYESWHGEDGVEKEWNLTWSMPVLLEFQPDGLGTWTEIHEWGNLTGFASLANGTISASLQANGPVQYDGKAIINVAEKAMEGTMTEESHTDTSMWTKGPWSAIMVADQSELSDCFRELKVGITGKDVAVLKTRLYELGYFSIDPGTDNFTSKTGEAVAAFEKLNGLPADGIADPVMLALFYSGFAIPNQR